MSKRGPSGINWQSIRLELAETAEFPMGSATRAYILHLPLRDDGTIDEPAFRANPVIAGFRRFWPNEADRYGVIVRTERGWALSFRHAADRGDALFPIEMDRLLPGDPVKIDKNGCRHFRVVDLSFGADA